MCVPWCYSVHTRARGQCSLVCPQDGLLPCSSVPAGPACLVVLEASDTRAHVCRPPDGAVRCIRSLKYAVYVTVPLPYFLLVCIFIRGVTLPGALTGPAFPKLQQSSPARPPISPSLYASRPMSSTPASTPLRAAVLAAAWCTRPTLPQLRAETRGRSRVLPQTRHVAPLRRLHRPRHGGDHASRFCLARRRYPPRIMYACVDPRSAPMLEPAATCAGTYGERRWRGGRGRERQRMMRRGVCRCGLGIHRGECVGDLTVNNLRPTRFAVGPAFPTPSSRPPSSRPPCPSPCPVPPPLALCPAGSLTSLLLAFPVRGHHDRLLFLQSADLPCHIQRLDSRLLQQRD